MKSLFNWLLSLTIIFMMAGCSKEYKKDFVIKGTIKEVNEKEQVLLIKDDQKSDNVFEIPTDDIENYKVGQKVEVTIFSNTDADVWDPNNMKFEMKRMD